MERNPRRGLTNQQKNYEQARYNNVEIRNDMIGSENQRFLNDPSSNINTNTRPPDYMSVGARPVLNYSIQTGEEFSLEFMRERVNPRQNLVPNAYGDSNSTTVYMDLKGLLGITHTGSESGSDISMINSNEKGNLQDFERKVSSANDKNYYSFIPPRASSRNESIRGSHGYASSAASDMSSTKIKFLCSFGGKILPRPSDGRLRYVGGETRIIRINKDISWQALMQKILSVYSETHAMKYQLPGEDLDALVSVSCDEDLQNMMEECNMLEDGGSQKPRMFLFSISDLEDSQLGQDSTGGDSEIQYVVAVNGMDLGSRKNSVALASNSGNNLDELLSLHVERDSLRVDQEAVGGDALSLKVNVPSSAVQSAELALPNLSSTYSNSQPSQEQMLHHGEANQHLSPAFHPIESFPEEDGKATIPLHYGYDSHPATYTNSAENISQMPVHGILAQQGELVEGQLNSSFHVQDLHVPNKDLKLKREISAQKIYEPEKTQSLEKELPLKDSKMKREGSLQKVNESDQIRNVDSELIFSSHQYDGSVPNYIPREEVSVADFDGVSPLLLTKNKKTHLELGQNSVAPEEVSDEEKSTDDQFLMTSGVFTPGFSAAITTDLNYIEPSIVPQRNFHSERLPREQAELNRLSKSDDSFGSQFLIKQALSDNSQPTIEPVDKLHYGNVVSQSEQSTSSSKPPNTNSQIDDGSTQFGKYNKMDENVNKKNSNVSEGGHAPNMMKSELRHPKVNPMDDHEMTQDKENHSYNDPFSNDARETVVLNHSAEGQGTSDSSTLRPSEFEWSEIAANKNNVNYTKGHPQPLAYAENPIKDVSREDSNTSGVTREPGDILIDINDRFPRDFLSDIFSRARISENLAGINPLHGDGMGLSLNMENHEPKHWSYFQKLAQDEFVRNDVSLMDQDHLGFAAPLTNTGDGATVDYGYPPLKSDGVAFPHIDSNVNFDEEIQREPSGIIGSNTITSVSAYNPSLLKGSENSNLDGLKTRIPESEYEDGMLNIQNTGGPLVDLSLGDFDLKSLQIIKNEDLEELRELGSGTFGTVYHGKWRGTDVAIKRIKKSCFTGRSSEQERLTVEFWREADILSKLHHPNVVAFYGVVQDGPGATLATVAEFMVNGSLRHVLVSKDRHLDRRKRLTIAMDAAFGMEYLHSKNIVHFDLKCDNLLVNLKDPLRPICKVGDFGLSKIKRNTLVTGGVRGTLPWMAPELLNGSSSKVSEKVDVFSFGIVLWEILTGEEPYANMHYGAIIGGIVNNTLRPPVPGFCDPDWRVLMEQCWAPDPADRPSFTEITRRLRVMSQTKQPGHQLQNQLAKS
ncbi:Mitogen-activated protein kinase kinase kinase [Quillaja saponaria]|uniref:Mitogen-activated protein kinase kinase kinase n=1 Tax=Quillaja saponaria TaxID=32244 RepID=A0AAD7P5E1_QUISA|nr:Mitogen-activated protein kinase kinase kinase [Quillaja saponaria]